MSQRIAKEKTLFTVPDSPDERPSLLGGLCSCGYLFFPPHRFGCESCGAAPSSIHSTEIDARGVLKSFAAFHRKTHSYSSSSLIFGLVLLNSGLTIITKIQAEDETKLAIGQKVQGLLVPCGQDDQGQTIVDCLFVPERGAG
jgi:uncharacterized OB-fold protein